MTERARPTTFAMVKTMAHNQWPGILANLGIDDVHLGGRHGPCPGCGGKDRFRAVLRDGELKFYCSGGGSALLTGDGFALLEHAHGWTPAEALHAVARTLGLDQV